MGKIIKKSVEKITVNKEKFSLGMKGEFKIEFANDSFGPYEYKFEREDCYFQDGLSDRGSKIFPLKNKEFDNTEIFLETDDIVVATGERGSLIGDDKTFIDIINIKTEQKIRIFTDEVNLIYNTEKEIVVNFGLKGKFKTFILDFETMKIIEEKEEKMLAFFKSVYKNNSWHQLDFIVGNNNEVDEEKKYQKGYFKLINTQKESKPVSFDREKFSVELEKGKLDIWEESKI